MKKRNIFVTADWHLGHKNCLVFDDRPFIDIDDMTNKLIKRFNATVPDDGITYFLGDMGRINNLKEIINKLKGTKILILGNHDNKMHAMLNKGFDAVLSFAGFYIGEDLVTMSHCPLRGVFREDTSNFKHSAPGDNWHRETFLYKYSLPNMGQFHLHGHVHFHKGKGEIKKNRQWDVGIVGNNYTPVSYSQIESWITHTKKEELKNENKK